MPPPPQAPPVPSVSVVVAVGGARVLRYSRPPPPPPAPPNWGDPDPDLILLLRSLGPWAPPAPVAATSFVGPEPRDLLPTARPEGSNGLVWAQGGEPLVTINGVRRGGNHLRLLLRHGPPPRQARGLLTLWVCDSPQGERGFCLVGRPETPLGGN